MKHRSVPLSLSALLTMKTHTTHTLTHHLLHSWTPSQCKIYYAMQYIQIPTLSARLLSLLCREESPNSMLMLGGPQQALNTTSTSTPTHTKNMLFSLRSLICSVNLVHLLFGAVYKCRVLFLICSFSISLRTGERHNSLVRLLSFSLNFRS